jgi:RNA polymerase sporulation-specific sigma factor
MSNYENMADNELVLLANDGDDVAMEVLISRYKNFVRAKTRSYFLIGADRDDIIQEGMRGLFKAIRDFDGTKNNSFRTFAELCVTRQIITAVKTATRLKHTPLNNYVSFNKPVYEDDTEKTLLEILNNRLELDPEEIIINKEKLEETEEKIKDNLSKFENTVLNLYLQGKNYQEIAIVLEKPAKSIDNALQRIKKKIITVIEK